MSAARREAALWLAQRGTAMVLAFCVIVHLATIVIAVRGGLAAADILERTRGSVAWAVFYVIFVLAVAVHGTIGLRTVLGEWLGLRGERVEAALLAVALILAAMGLRAVVAVFWA
jgi:fumarate reductase subunit C